ncbi:MAG: LptE family protein [Candidatus Cloacimonadota bacterium]|nr:LptE family protein [Candidatus Cloacimonadota bacterium]
MKRLIKKYMIYITLLLIITAFGCTYSLYSNALPHIKTVQIAEFENQSSEYVIEESLTDLLLQKFEQDRKLKIVTINSDCILEGEILDYSDEIKQYSSSDEIEQYEVKILFNITFTDLVKNEEIWSNDSLLLKEIYSTSSEETSTIANSAEEAFEIIVDNLYKEILKNSLEEW